MLQFENVSVIKKANVYFDGKCVSHTVQFADGKRTNGQEEQGGGKWTSQRRAHGKQYVSAAGNRPFGQLGHGLAISLQKLVLLEFRQG